MALTRVPAEMRRDHHMVPISRYNGDLQAALNAMSAAGGGTVVVDQDSTLDVTVTFPGDDLTIQIEEGVTLTQGANANPGIYCKGRTNCMIKGPGTFQGNYTEAGAWEKLVTGLGITDGDATGTAAANYTAGATSTITINDLGTGYVKKGARLSYIVASTTYAYIVQANAAITAGSATVTLDRVLAANITSGQSIFINEFNRNAVISQAYSAGATSITIQAPDAAGSSGLVPRMRAGDQFCFYGDYNDVFSEPDYSEVYTVQADVDFAGSYPTCTATVTITPPLATGKVNGQMITSIMDHRNNRFPPIVFFGCTNCHVDGIKLVDARLHGAVFNAVISAPWDGVDPATQPNVDCSVRNVVDADGAEGAIAVAAHANGFAAEYIKADGYAAGQNRIGVTLEKTANAKANFNTFRNMYAGININAGCQNVQVDKNIIEDPLIGIWQINASRNVSGYGNLISMSDSITICGLVIVAGSEDANERRINSAVWSSNHFIGSTSIGNPSYGSAIEIAPIGFNAAATEDDWPRGIVLRDNCIDGAGRHGIRIQKGSRIKLIGNEILNVGYEGIHADDAISSVFADNYVEDCGQAAAAVAFSFPTAVGNTKRGNFARKIASANMVAGVSAFNTGAAPSGVRRTMTANQAVPTGTNHVVTFDNTIYDSMGAIDGSGDIVVPDGVFYAEITCTALWAASSVGARLVQILVNGTAVAGDYRNAISSADATVRTGKIGVAPGDVIAMRVNQNTGSDLDLIGAGVRTSITAEWV